MDGVKFEFDDIIPLYTKNDSAEHAHKKLLWIYT